MGAASVVPLLFQLVPPVCPSASSVAALSSLIEPGTL